MNVLIPTDFSEVSYLALQMAGVLGRRIPVTIHLLHVIETDISVLTDQPELSETLDVKEFEKQKEHARKEFESLRTLGLKFNSYVHLGLLTDQINKTAEELNADMVIMGTHGASGFMEKISGSEAQHVARYLTIPVLTVRPGTLVNDIKNILLVADFELFGKGVQINMIKTIAEAFGSTIHLLQILHEGEEKYADQITQQMNFFAQQYGLSNYEVHIYRDQKVASGVRNFNREAEMDLVCIRTHGRKGISHLLFGSIAERLVNHCIKPLLTFQLKKNA